MAETTSLKRPLVQFNKVGRTFGTVEALSPCDLTVDRGEFVSIIGPSGCGKSTLLRLGSGLDRPTTGAVEYATDSIGYVFQDATLMPWRTVRANASLLGRLGGMSKAAVDKAVTEALEIVGLTKFAGHLPHQLSGGMKMRTSIARSLVLDPEVFLFDEPFGALDEITRGRLNLVLRGLWLERRFAGLMVTHSVEEAVFMSTKVVVMSPHPGKIEEVFEIPFGAERSLDLRYTPEFAEVAGKVAASLEAVS